MKRSFILISFLFALMVVSCRCSQTRYETATPGGGESTLPPPEVKPAADTVFRIVLTGEDCPYADRAEYGCYVPEKVSRFQGVLVLQHGCGMEQFGLTRHYDLQYQAFARKWNLVVIETALYGPCGVWGNPESGSAAGLVRVLAKVANKTGHFELNSAPWLLWGHSGGGYWTLGMLRDYPERILAIVCYSAAWDPTWDYSAAAAEVPILLRHAGDNDGDPTSKCKETARHTFAKLRAMGAPASIVLNKDQNHNLSYLRTMAIPFWEAALRQRLSPGGVKSLDPAQTWLADTTTFEIFREADYDGADKSRLARLPDEASARAWQEFAKTNVVKDVTAPPAPTGVKAVLLGEVLEISWQASADVESGIARFNVYQDGIRVGVVPEDGVFQNYDTNGDNAYPVPVPAMKLRLVGRPDRKVRFSVEAVNRDGLSSAKTEITYKP